MFNPNKEKGQPPLPFACASCLYKGIGRCRGPIDIMAYMMQGHTIVPCTDIERRQQFFNDLYDSTVPIAKQSHQNRIILPAFIPGVRDGLSVTPKYDPNSLFALSLGKLIGEKGTILYDSIDILKQKLRLPPDARIALIGTAKDYKIERLWATSNKTGVWKRIADFGFDFVTSLTFSVYDDSPRATQIYNQARNFLTHDLFASLEVPSIPFLFPYNKEDYVDAFSWLKERPDINKVAVLAQFYKSDKQFKQFLYNMQMIRDGVAQPLEFLVVGVGKLNRIAMIMKEFNACIVSAKPFHRALSGLRATDDLNYLETDELRWDMTHAELAVHNTRQHIQRCEELRKQSTDFNEECA